MKRSSIVAVVLGLLTTSCSLLPPTTVAISEATGALVPTSRILLPEFTSRPIGLSAKVVFLRDKGRGNSGCGNQVFVNDQQVFTLYGGEYLALYLAPGSYNFMIKPGNEGLCSFGPTLNKSTILVDGAEERYRLVFVQEDMKQHIIKI